MSKKLPSRSNHHALSLTHGNIIPGIFFILSQFVKLIHALPILRSESVSLTHHDYGSNSDSSVGYGATANNMTAEEFYVNLITSVCLVLAGGVFAGLTLGLMGQDEVYLKVIATSGDSHERKHARKVLQLIGRGKHWVLVTLLLSNVITNETLPIVLDRCLGGGWPAVVTSTASIVVFGEIIPQSICVRYGLEVGSLFAPFVLILMYIMYPIAYPIALLLDHVLGEDHGTVYKKSGLKTLVTLHRSMGVERLNQDEVTIISAVLDLKAKPVSSIMTPMNRVYTMSADRLLDSKTVEEIFNAGFSRIPIHLPNEPLNFIGMLLVRVLISYDPEDALPVASFPLATLPETALDTSCLNILNYFQEGKSHMIVVSEQPGEPVGAVGVLTLEDVIEELIGEEIVDESDVYIDINKNIKRKNPGPLSKRNLTAYLHNLYHLSGNNSKRNSLDASSNGNGLTIGPSGLSGQLTEENVQDLASKLGVAAEPTVEGESSGAVKNWKPKNPASNPLETNKSFVTIKRPHQGSIVDANLTVIPGPNRQAPAGSKGYGAIHINEEGAIEESRNQHHDSSHLYLLPNEREADVSELNENKIPHGDNNPLDLIDIKDSENVEINYNGGGTSPTNKSVGADDVSRQGIATTSISRDIPRTHSTTNNASSSKINNPEYQESRSFRTGGIIESIVNVQGVHKTIIENVSDDDRAEISIENLNAVSLKKKKKKSSKKKKKKRSDSITLNQYSSNGKDISSTGVGNAAVPLLQDQDATDSDVLILEDDHIVQEVDDDDDEDAESLISSANGSRNSSVAVEHEQPPAPNGRRLSMWDKIKGTSS